MTKKKRCRICRAEEGRQHKFDCTFDRYQAYNPSSPIYVDTTSYGYSSDTSSSSSSCDSGSSSSGSCE